MPTIVRLFVLVTMACAGGACSFPSRLGHGVKHFFSSDRPLAVARFEENRLPIAPGSHGVMVGYIPRSDDALAAQDPKDALFTYLIEFRVTSSRELGRQIEARGVRRVFFNPGGARASFGDPLSFIRGREVETDQVRFSGEYTPEESRLRLRMRIYESTPEPVEFEGQPVAAPLNEPSIFLGRWRENFGGWVLSGSPMSF